MKTIVQCATCPWKVTTVPDCDIPNGYSTSLHQKLSCTIAKEVSLRPGALRAMACHYSPIGKEHACAGWLHHQLGVGNNIAVRLGVMSGRLPVPNVDGDQHERFEDTLPKKSKKRRKTP